MANTITFFRIAASIVLLFCPVFSPAFYVFYIAAGLSDMLDGFVARKTDTVSKLGARLDTMADFVFVVVCLIKLLPVLSIPAWLYAWIGIIALIKNVNIISDLSGYLLASKIGKQQADRIAEKLKQELDGKEVILYTSDLKRAKQTADSIASRFQVKPIVRKELRERNLGRCCGKSVQWLRENLECDEKTIDDRLFSDAESRRDEWNRLKSFFDQVMAEDSENIIIVSHGDLLSVFNSMFLGLEVESLTAYEMFGFACGVSQLIVRDDGKRIIKRISDMSFVR